MKRIFLTVLDSLGIGTAPDAKRFGDFDCNTLKRISGSGYFKIPNLINLGIGNTDGIDYIEKKPAKAGFVRMREASNGKDTTIGHWEISGIISDKPLPTYPLGFPPEIISQIEEATGRRVIVNKPYSGTRVIYDYGEEQLKTGALIVYTSADSVLQIAAHEEKIGLENLYDYCRKIRKIMCGRHAVGRIIARPFTGSCKEDFKRTSNRHDFSLEPPAPTVLDALFSNNFDVISIGKIYDIFAGKSITEYSYTHSNKEGMQKMLEYQMKDFCGLCFTNLVDFDMNFGHRQDIDGYAKALSEFDSFLPLFINGMKEDDLLMITADHGCDPGDLHTDHTREYTPLIIIGKSVKPGSCKTRNSFADIGASIASIFGVGYKSDGCDFSDEFLKLRA